MRLLTGLGALMLAVAVGFGTVNKLCPALFMSIPHIGFVFWAIGGNTMPPFMDDYQKTYSREDMRTWAKDGDVIVATAAKSGTHWMMNCVHQIRTGGDDSYPDLNLVSPWAGMVHKPGQTWDEMKVLLNTTVLPEGTKVKDLWDNPKYPFRLWKSHFGAAALNGGKSGLQVINPRDPPGVKYVVMVRSGRDAVRSIFSFFNTFTDEFRTVWGGFPPPTHKAEESLEFVLDNDFYFGHATSWWQYRNDPNVLLLHFTNAKKDLEGTVRQLADFVGVKIPTDKFPGVLERCGYKWMKEHPEKFLFRMWADTEYDHAGYKMMHSGGIVRSGKVGESKDFFTPEMAAKWLAAEEKHTAHDPVMREWINNGGPLPKQ
eukprot:TRINITY_DN8923_c0_g1_i1.p1 TRINITY_DN8923_c0_g1~~TRINITY_DN8923_c0_g1_i1.p1  ORF type:complete len:372 (+),score=96.35 TRINITY_DN8923_c0_g1_i1:100-1215(+)